MDSPTYLMGILGFMALLLAAIVAVLLNRLPGRTEIRIEARPLLTQREREVLVLIERAVRTRASMRRSRWARSCALRAIRAGRHRPRRATASACR